MVQTPQKIPAPNFFHPFIVFLLLLLRNIYTTEFSILTTLSSNSVALSTSQCYVTITNTYLQNFLHPELKPCTQSAVSDHCLLDQLLEPSIYLCLLIFLFRYLIKKSQTLFVLVCVACFALHDFLSSFMLWYVPELGSTHTEFCLFILWVDTWVTSTI